MKRIYFFVMATVLVMGIMMFMAACDGGIDLPEQVDPPEPVYKVQSVTINYNDSPVEGVLFVNMSMGTINLSASVVKDEQADGTVTWDASDKTVATVSSAGEVTLHKSGETVISAAAGEKKHEIVLVVGAVPTQPNTYTITVNGGTASHFVAAAGEHITLTPVIPEKKSFVRWEYEIDGKPATDLTISGNLFYMPSANIVINAVYETLRHSLNLIGATIVTVDGEPFTEPGVPGGNTKPDEGDGNLEEYALTIYRVPVDAEVVIETVDEPDGKMFVGWDVGQKHNRIESMSTQYEFIMPNETLTIWAQFSDRDNKLLTRYNQGPGNDYGHSSSYSDGFRLISEGKYTPSIDTWTPAPDAVADPDLEGGSGYRLSYAANQKAVTESPENIQGSYFNTIGKGTLIMKWIFKNHSPTLAIVLEVYVTQLGNNVSTGHVRIEPGEVKVVYVEGRLGIQDPWMGCVVREDIGGQPEDPRVLVDMVCIVASKYPDGDKTLAVSGNPEWVTFTPSHSNNPYPEFPHLYGDGVFTYSGPWGNRDAHWLNNSMGLLMLACWGANVDLNSTASIPISNMPAYDPDQPTTTIYLRIINNIAQVATYKWGIATTPNDPSTFVATFPGSAEEETPGRNGGYTLDSFEVKVVKLEIPRTAGDNGKYYLTVVKTYRDTVSHSDGVSGQHICMQLAYNNVFWYEEV